jgi:hypothetical protein
MAVERRRGVALIFVVVTLAVMLILATVILANTASVRRSEAVLAGITELIRFGYEIGDNEKKPSFRGDVVAHPSRLSHLYSAITVGELDSCGVPYSGAEVNSWDGPYHLVPMVRDRDYQLAPGIIASDLLERTPVNNNGPGTLAIVMPNVQLETAQAFGLAVDGISTGAGPKITFSPSGNAPVTMRYNVPIDRC